jgi:EAL domain-containing protein (putative c-di-GMP-specific phosphodiesterase class I)
MLVTAEGVETEDQLVRIQHEGCTDAQGYLFSKPRPAHELAALLERLDKKAADGPGRAAAVAR